MNAYLVRNVFSMFGFLSFTPHVCHFKLTKGCGHCQAFAPEYKMAAKKLKGLVKVGAIDCDKV
jgi:thiol-disulfide isomerase/thioredoxin